MKHDETSYMIIHHRHDFIIVMKLCHHMNCVIYTYYVGRYINEKEDGRSTYCHFFTVGTFDKVGIYFCL
jgi:hypothetical protein